MDIEIHLSENVVDTLMAGGVILIFLLVLSYLIYKWAESGGW